MDLFSLKNKVAIVTGASKGIGLAIACGLEKAGATVYGIARTDSSNEMLPFNYLRCDITQVDSFSDIVDDIYIKNSMIDILINAAGITLPLKNSQLKQAQDSLKQTFDTNVYAPFNTMMIVSEYMKKKTRGSIINITSIAAEYGFPDNPSYVASKGALKMLTKAFAEDLACYNIRVNNIVPGYIHTDMTNGSFVDPKLYKQRLNNTMMKRWGVPDDLLGAAIFLSSDAASYVTGTDLFVDGGWSAKGMV